MQQARARATSAAAAPRSLLKECLEAARRGWLVFFFFCWSVLSVCPPRLTLDNASLLLARSFALLLLRYSSPVEHAVTFAVSLKRNMRRMGSFESFCVANAAPRPRKKIAERSRKLTTTTSSSSFLLLDTTSPSPSSGAGVAATASGGGVPRTDLTGLGRPPSVDQEAGFLAGLEVASIVGGGSSINSGRPSRTPSFANLSSPSASASASAAATPRSSPPPPKQHQLPRQQQIPPSSLGVSPPLRPPVPLPQATTPASESLVSNSPTFASSMQQYRHKQLKQQQRQQQSQQQQGRCSSEAEPPPGSSASSSQRQEQQA